jgi:hypothetical protein
MMPNARRKVIPASVSFSDIPMPQSGIGIPASVWYRLSRIIPALPSCVATS